MARKLELAVTTNSQTNEKLKLDLLPNEKRVKVIRPTKDAKAEIEFATECDTTKGNKADHPEAEIEFATEQD